MQLLTRQVVDCIPQTLEKNIQYALNLIYILYSLYTSFKFHFDMRTSCQCKFIRFHQLQ